MNIDLEDIQVKCGLKHHIKKMIKVSYLKQKYKCIKTEKAIYYYREYFSFGNNIYINNNCTKNNVSYLNNRNSYNIP